MMQEEFESNRSADRYGMSDESLGDVSPQRDTGRTEVVNANDGEGQTAPEAGIALSGAPEAYAFAAPEGMSITPEIRAEIEPVFRELNLSDQGVAKLMPLAEKMMDRNLRAIETDHSRLKAQWAKEVKADAVLGGPNWGRTERNLVAVLDAGKATPEFRQLLNHTGLGSHPEFVRFFNTIGSRLRAGRVAENPIDRESTRFPQN